MQWGKRAEEDDRDRGGRADSGSGNYLRYFKDEKTPVRFLVDPKHWVVVWFHYLGGRKLPCKGRDECPGCKHPSDKTSKASKAYCAPVVLTAQDGEPVVGMTIPATVYDALLFEMKEADEDAAWALGRDWIVYKRKGVDNRVTYSIKEDEAYRLPIQKIIGDFAAEHDTASGYDALQSIIQSMWDDNIELFASEVERGPGRRSQRDDDEAPRRSASRWDEDEAQPPRSSTRRGASDEEASARRRSTARDPEDERPRRSHWDDEPAEAEVAKVAKPSDAEDDEPPF